jgi:methionyl-tRNA formyltransferase
MEKITEYIYETPRFCSGSLDSILENNYELVGVITALQTNPTGRGQKKIKYSAVKNMH